VSLASFAAYVVAAIAIIISPGPFVTVVIANSLRHGVSAGLLNVLGGQIGLGLWAFVAFFGLSTAIHALGMWFDVIKGLGAAYLVYLGVKLWRAHGQLLLKNTGNSVSNFSKTGFITQGFYITMSNPKVLLVFAALIPQFIVQGPSANRDLFILCIVFMLLATISDGAYAVLAGQIRKSLTASRVQWIEKLSGSCLIAGGLWLAIGLF
jgi:threonine/homoserine/homoserine lactone efflux protein